MTLVEITPASPKTDSLVFAVVIKLIGFNQRIANNLQPLLRTARTFIARMNLHQPMTRGENEGEVEDSGWTSSCQHAGVRLRKT